MAIQDLTPQLRTRLSRIERIVGVFILAATLMMLVGLFLFLRQTAENKGWFVLKAPYYTYLRSGTGIHVGDKVKLMGFDVGEVTEVKAMPPEGEYDVFIAFVVLGEYHGYIWSESTVDVKSAGLLGNRYLEVVKGSASTKRVKQYASFKVNSENDITEVLTDKEGHYKPFKKKDKSCAYYIPSVEPPELSSQMDAIVQQAKDALPQVLALTNFLTRVMSNTAEATERINRVLVQVEPIVQDLAVISGQLKNPKGSLGEWLIPTNMNVQLTSVLSSANQTLISANGTLTNANAQMTKLSGEVDASLENLSQITAALRRQVEGNTNVLTDVSRLIVDTDNLIQGLKRHWLLRSAFRGTNSPDASRAPLRPQDPRRR